VFATDVEDAVPSITLRAPRSRDNEDNNFSSFFGLPVEGLVIRNSDAMEQALISLQPSKLPWLNSKVSAQEREKRQRLYVAGKERRRELREEELLRLRDMCDDVDPLCRR
jgi:hypothetical protein